MLTWPVRPGERGGTHDAAHRIGAHFDADDVRALAELGFSALMRGADTVAETLFTGVAAARPDGEAGPLGLALVQLYRGAAGEAVTLLRRLPPSDAVRLYLGMALMRQGDRSEARGLLADLTRTASDPSFARLAQSVLDENAPHRPSGRSV